MRTTSSADPQAPLRLSTPHVSARVSSEESASVIARLMASGLAQTQADLVRQTGLARSTVNSILVTLNQEGVIAYEGTAEQSGRGRPGERVGIAPDFGLILVVEIDRRSTRARLYDYGQGIVASFDIQTSIMDHPTAAVAAIQKATLEQVASAGVASQLRIAVVAVAALVDVRRGTVVGPPRLEGWGEFLLEPALVESLGCPVIIRNEVDLQALGESRSLPPSESPLLFIRLELGIGMGYVDQDGAMFTGVDGAAGEISHIRSGFSEGRVCICGGIDHLWSYASVRSMVDRWRETDSRREEHTYVEFAEALASRDIDATRIATDASRVLGAALTDILLVLNPARISIGSSLVDTSDVMLATIRGVIYETGLPLATRNLTVGDSVLGREAALRGGLVLALEESLSPSYFVRLLQDADAHAH